MKECHLVCSSSREHEMKEVSPEATISFGAHGTKSAITLRGYVLIRREAASHVGFSSPNCVQQKVTMTSLSILHTRRGRHGSSQLGDSTQTQTAFV